MADKKAPAPAPEKEPKKKGGKLKLIIILVVALAVLGGGGFAAWKFFLHPKDAENATAENAEGHNPEAAAEVDAGGQLVTLDSFVVNLSDPMGADT